MAETKDIAKKKSRFITLDGNKYRVNPASRKIIRALKDIDIPDLSDDDADLEAWMEAMMSIIDLRITPVGENVPGAREALYDLWDSRGLIGPEEVNELMGQINGAGEDDPPR